MNAILLILTGGACAHAGVLTGLAINKHRDRPQADNIDQPLVHLLEHHPTGCICGGRGQNELGDDCPVLWRLPQDKVRVVGRLPRGSQR